MSWLQRRWQHLMTIHPRPDVHRWWQACLLFAWLLVGEQVVFAGYYTGHYMGADWFGLLLAIYFAWLYLKLPLAYGQNRNWPGLNLASMRRVGITVGGMFLASQGWHWLGPKLLGLQTKGGASSANQHLLISLFHSGWAGAAVTIGTTLVVAPLIEEFCFRYLVLTPTRHQHERWRLTVAIGGFSLMHVAQQLPQVAAGQLSLLAWLYYFVDYAIIGAGLSLLYRRYRQYGLNVMAHATWNLVALLMMW